MNDDFQILAELDLSWQRCIYALCDQAEAVRVRYVGATQNPVFGRIGQHLEAAAMLVADGRWPRAGVGAPVARWLADLLRHGEMPRVLILETVIGRSQLPAAERRWIHYFCERGQADLNRAGVPKSRKFSEPSSEIGRKRKAERDYGRKERLRNYWLHKALGKVAT